MTLSRHWVADQLGRQVEISSLPRRIISLVPSQTELLYDLGLTTEVVGITKFCVHPDEWFRSKTRVGGTKQVHLDIVRSLQPDLIIANKEENDAAQVMALMAEFPVWVSDIHDLTQAQEMIETVGSLTGKAAQAAGINKKITEGFNELRGIRKKAAYFIWREPWMVAGGDTFIHDMMQRCGLENVFGGELRYPEVDITQLPDCELVLLSSEPYPFRDKHIAELKRYLPGADVRLVDGEMFSWYGSRLMYAFRYFMEML